MNAVIADYLINAPGRSGGGEYNKRNLANKVAFDTP